MEIKDLAGMSEPLTRLIEVSSAALGTLTKPYNYKKMAAAKAYEIKVISDAIHKSRNVFDSISYNKEQVIATCTQRGISEERTNSIIQLAEKSNERVMCKEIKQQENIENILSEAAQQLSTETNAPEDKPSEDWTSRFFRYSEDINSAEMQNLWGKILAGEIKRPNTYSLRTLETIRNINSREAEIFSRLGKYALEMGGSAYVVSDRKFLEKKGLSFKDLLLLQEIGLICHGDLQFKISPKKKGVESCLIYSDHAIILERADDTPEMSMAAIIYTATGVELLSLVEKSISKSYLNIVASRLKKYKGVSLSFGSIYSIEDGIVTVRAETAKL